MKKERITKRKGLTALNLAIDVFFVMDFRGDEE
jgi:hypothetical protein